MSNSAKITNPVASAECTDNKLEAVGAKGTGKYALKTAAYAFFAAAVALLPFVIKGAGVLFLQDDFNYQQVVFNILCGDFFKSGNLGWSWYTDLGSNAVGSYSFYNLASPFSLLTVFLPASVIPYMTAPVLAVKYCAAAVTAFYFINRFVKNPDTAVFGAVLYAFSGFQTMNLLFPFHDVTALFPLMLIAVEEIAENPRRSVGFLALAAGLLCCVNYYCFFGQIIFLIIYFVFRFLIVGGKRNLKKTGLLALRFALEGLLGLGISAVVLLPSALSVLQNPRLDSSVSQIIFHWTQYLSIAQGFFLPADVMGSSAYFLEKACTSCALCLPFVAMSFVFAYILKYPKKSFSLMSFAMVIIACVPFLNSSFSMFNAHYYARWFYMAGLVFALMSAIAIDNAEHKFIVRGTLLNAAVTILLVMAEFGLIAIFKATSHPYLPKIDIKTTALYAIFALVCVVGLLFVLKIRDNKKFIAVLTASVLATAVITSWAALYRYKKPTDNTANIYETDIINKETPLSEERTLEILTDITAEKLSLPKDLNYRIRTAWYDRGLDYYCHSYDNLSMTIGVPSVNSFISTVSGGIFEFYQGLGIDRNVTSVDNDDPALSALLSCRYYLTSNAEKELAMGKKPVGTYTHSDGTVIYTFEYDSFLPFGFTYDMYITETQLEALPKKVRPYALLRAVVVEDSSEAIFDNDALSPFVKTPEYAELLNGKEITDNDILNASSAHLDECSTQFTRTDTGFSCKITSTEGKLAYFSVPNESGWTATVNGNVTDIVSSNGMMAVSLCEGENNISFKYETPGLRLGACISVVSLTLTILGFVYFRTHQGTVVTALSSEKNSDESMQEANQ